LQNAFYAITATHGDLESALYGYAGELDFPLATTTGTDFNAVAFPFAQPIASTAADLVARFPQMNSVAFIDPVTGSLQQFIPALPATNFSISSAQPLLVNATMPGMMSVAGFLADGSYQLRASPEGRLNAIVLPFSKRHLTRASDLLANIPRCSQVGRWNAEAQAVEFYQPSQPASNFALTPGWPYFVRVNQDVTWP
ncbi:MAG: hypothetical protein H5U38_09340, partial [Calditrichaeota bacterium]|nr:hypothetical protein [Calditrichota bacterium]